MDLFKNRATILALGVFMSTGGTSHSAEHHWSLDAFSDDIDLEFNQGRRPRKLFGAEYVKLVGSDTKYVFTSPARWDRQDWSTVVQLSAGVLATTLLDDEIRLKAQLNRTLHTDRATELVQRFGEEYSFAVLAGFGLVGTLGKNAKARAVAMDGITASIIASGLITPGLKYTVGRKRPYAASGVFDVEPFSGNYSFPSGHTTQAFAVASVVASHYDQLWIKGLSYSLAAGVGWSRIHQNKHYASDVVAGAIIGTVIGRTIVRRHNHLTDDDLGRWDAVASPQMTGLVWSRRF